MKAKKEVVEEILGQLNPQQRQAATHGDGPLLILAGAGTGKTNTLVHRVAWLVLQGVSPGRILLLTFTRRAAAEMLRRADALLAQIRRGNKKSGALTSQVWGGTFHAVATRLLRQYGKAIGLPADFVIHDRSDSEDFLQVIRTELKLAKTDRRFPQKGTCMEIYSRCVNARMPLVDVLATVFPWCAMWEKELARLFDTYIERKQQAGILDYDDLLLYWHALLEDAQAGPVLRNMFDYILVDEYQDTNRLQAEILYMLSPDGRGLTVVGDDAQAIYSFRAAEVRNIFEFPEHYPNATIITLEQNYRSTQPILEATNQVIALAQRRYVKNLWTERTEGPRPELVLCQDEQQQADEVIQRILERRESGLLLRQQAVLFRASHHSMLLETELNRRNIPYHKYGGLKFSETAHVKDLLAILRLAENPRDTVAGMRVLVLLPGIGPKTAKQLMELLQSAGGQWEAWRSWKPPAAAAGLWDKWLQLLEQLTASPKDASAQIHAARTFYQPLLEEKYDNPYARSRDLEQLELIASRYPDRRSFLAEMALDPPSSTQDLAGPPILDEDFLVLSTMHSAKGLEWEAVYVINATDGNIPSDMTTGSPELIDEELRLFYVALTRARRHLAVFCPLFHYYGPFGKTDEYGMSQLTRFLPRSVQRYFHVQSGGRAEPSTSEFGLALRPGESVSAKVRQNLSRLWH
ncbi:MAG: ATP-dependent helicase [Thermoguttaceae bacterium]|nr:ATP-dependent helicase [Thermoguttaceae bacterium]MDW8038905.1 ATP-dependent helicase [Thermoguttaceae bacterium]